MNGFSKRQLLELEQHCDAYEAALRAGGQPDIDDVLTQASPEIVDSLRAELELIRDEHERNLAADSNATLRECQTLHELDGDACQPGALLSGRYEMVELIGQGGAAVVWLARDSQLDRDVAIKIPHRQLLASSLESDGQSGGGSTAEGSSELAFSFNSDFRVGSPAERFLREARTAATLRHRNIVRVIEVGHDGDLCYLVSEYVDGKPLSVVLREESLSLEQKIQVLAKVAEAVAYSHERGVVHRDLKPQNILLDSNSEPFVADFGLAKQLKQDATLTRQGDLLGTPAYMSPEQAAGSGREADERSDVYSLGVVLFQMLTGDVPFHGSVESIVFQVLHHEPPPPRRWSDQTPADLETLCLKCLEKEPQHRFGSAIELAEELRRYLAGEPIRCQPVSLGSKVWKWAKRNRGVATLATACLSLLVVTAFGATLSAMMLSRAYNREQSAKDDAVRLADAAAVSAQDAIASEHAALSAKRAALEAKDEAEEAARKAMSIVQFVEQVFDNSLLSSSLFAGGAESSFDMRTSVLRAANEVLETEGMDPAIRIHLANVVAQMCRSISAFDEAGRLLQLADTLYHAHPGALQGAQRLLVRSKTQFYQGWLAHNQEQFGQAETHYRNAVQTLEGCDEPCGRMIASVRVQWGRLLLEQREKADAQRQFAQAELLARDAPSDSKLRLAIRMGDALSRSEGPLPSFDVLLEMAQDAGVGDGNVLKLAEMVLLRSQGQYDRAVVLYDELIESMGRTIEDRNPFTLLAYGDFASLLWQAGEYERAQKIARRLVMVGDEVAPRHRHLRELKKKLGLELLRAGRMDDCTPLLREAFASLPPDRRDYELSAGLALVEWFHKDYMRARQHVAALQGWETEMSAARRAWVRYLNFLIVRDEDREIAPAALDAALEMAVGVRPKHVHDSLVAERVGVVLGQRDQFADQAHAFWLRARQLDEEKFPTGHPRLADRYVVLANSHVQRGEYTEAVALRELAIEIYQRRVPNDTERVARLKTEVRVAQQAELASRRPPQEWIGEQGAQGATE